MPRIKRVGKIDWYGINLFTYTDRQLIEDCRDQCRKPADKDKLSRLFHIDGLLLGGVMTVRIETLVDAGLTGIKNGEYWRDGKYADPSPRDYIAKIVRGLASLPGNRIGVRAKIEPLGNGAASVILEFGASYQISHPCEYLTALARKMSKWAVT